MLLFDYLDMLGTIVFAISGVLLAEKLNVDIIGAIVLGIAVAIGGGTIRDILLKAPIFWMDNNRDLIISVVTCIISYVIISKYNLSINKYLLPITDAIGLAAFLAIGVDKSFSYNQYGVNALIMGVMTAVGGGIIRDILAREIPYIFRKEIYSIACIIGAIIQVICFRKFGISQRYCMIIGFSITLIIRLYAIYKNLRLPALISKNRIKKYSKFRRRK